MFRWFVFLALLFEGGGILYAAENSALYQSKVIVRDQSFIERQSAIKKAFEQALLRLTGDKKVLNSPIVLNARKNPSSFVSRFSYLAAEEESDEVETRPSLLVQFDIEATASLISRAGFDIWPNNRVMTTVIFGFYGFDIMGLDEDSAFFEEQREQWKTLFIELGEKYALPIQFVSTDTLIEVWQQTHAQVEPESLKNIDLDEASQGEGLNKSLLVRKSPRWIDDLLMHYGRSASVLLGQLSLNLNGKWQTRWQHYQPEAYTQKLYTGTAQRVTQRLFWQVVKRLRDDYFNHRTVLKDATVYVTVQGIEQLLLFQQAESALQALGNTTSIRTVSLNVEPFELTGSVLFELTVKGGALALQQALKLNTHFQRVVEDEVGVSDTFDSTQLVYQWH